MFGHRGSDSTKTKKSDAWHAHGGKRRLAVPVEEERGAAEIGKMPRLRIHVQIEGLLSVHAVRAVWTALGAVPGVLTAEVSMKGAILESEGPLDHRVLEEALAMAGVRVTAVTVEKGGLPLL
jgi:hypothetical protein